MLDALGQGVDAQLLHRGPEAEHTLNLVRTPEFLANSMNHKHQVIRLPVHVVVFLLLFD